MKLRRRFLETQVTELKAQLAVHDHETRKNLRARLVKTAGELKSTTVALETTKKALVTSQELVESLKAELHNVEDTPEAKVANG